MAKLYRGQGSHALPLVLDPVMPPPPVFLWAYRRLLAKHSKLALTPAALEPNTLIFDFRAMKTEKFPIAPTAIATLTIFQSRPKRFDPWNVFAVLYVGPNRKFRGPSCPSSRKILATPLGNAAGHIAKLHPTHTTQAKLSTANECIFSLQCKTM